MLPHPKYYKRQVGGCGKKRKREERKIRKERKKEKKKREKWHNDKVRKSALTYFPKKKRVQR